LLYKIKTRKNT